MELDIPNLLSLYNELRVAPMINVIMRTEAMAEDKKPSACIACGACTTICPQNIDIPGALADFAERLSKLPSWAETCRQREEAARKGK